METAIEGDSFRYPVLDASDQISKPANWPLMLAIGLMVGLDFLQSSMIVLSSAHIRGGVDASPEEFVWTTAVYAITVVLVILNQQDLVAWLGYRRYLTISLLIDALGSFLCANAHDVQTLIFGRIVQALGASGLFTSSRILLEISFEGKDYGRALTFFGYVPFALAALAPLWASVILDNAEWSLIFSAPIPLLLGCALLVYCIVPGRGQRAERVREDRENKVERQANFDYWPLALFSFAIIAGQTVLMRAQFQFISQSPALLLLLLIALLGLLLFGWHQWKAGQPMLHLRGLHLSKSFRWGLAFYAVYYLLTYSFSYIFPIYSEQALGFSAELTGRLLFFSNVMSLFALYFLINYAHHVSNRKWIMCSALICAGVGAWWIAHLAPGISPEKLYGPLALYGMFGVLLILPVAGMTFQEFDHNFFGHAYRVKNILRQLCSTCAVASMTSLLQHRQILHRVVLDANLSQNNVGFVERANTLSSALNGRGMNATDAKTAAIVLLNRIAEQQILVMSCLDVFLTIAAFAATCCAVLLIQNRLR